MPELPEVETVVRDLRRLVVGRRIQSVWTDWPKMIKDIEKQSRLVVSQKAVAYVQKHIRGRRIERVVRRGKNILIYLSGDHLLLVHQKMTGHFLLGRWRIVRGRAQGVSPRTVVEDSFNHHVHLLFTLDTGQQLGLSDVRKFAKLIFGPRQQIEGLPELTRLGPDALSRQLSVAEFGRLVRRSRRTVKQVLMDPFVIAGIGNIYSDDILWRARVHPRTPAHQLTTAQLRRLHQAMRAVLTTAVRLRGTSTTDFRDVSGKEGGYTEHRLVYQRTGQPCARCQTTIQRTVIGGRSAHFCPMCQTIY